MTDFKLIYLRSVAELRAAAPHWDELWYRSDVAAPTARAELIAQWLEQFAPRAAFCGLVVQHGGDFIAALPLVAGGLPRLRVAGLPANAWGLCGDLLLDPNADLERALQSLVDGLNHLPCSLLRLSPVAYESDRWCRLLAALPYGLIRSHITPIDEVGQVAVQASWHEYQSSWSANHRRQLRKARRRAETAGDLAIEIHRGLQATQLDELFSQVCQIEDRSWKGKAGTSILRSPGMFDWHLRQARRLAGWGQLQLAFLRHRGEAIACEYGYCAKATYYSAKVGYDPEYAQFSPGQLLRSMLLERFHRDRLHRDDAIEVVDFWGPLTPATAKWCTRIYRVGRITIAPDRPTSRIWLAGLAAIDRLKSASRRLASSQIRHASHPSEQSRRPPCRETSRR